MNKVEYLRRKALLLEQADKAQKELDLTYVQANNKVKIDDIIVHKKVTCKYCINNQINPANNE